MTLARIQSAFKAVSEAQQQRRERYNRRVINTAMNVYRGKPIDYAQKYLGKYVTPKQVEILEKLETPPYRVLARSANTQGKTFIGAVKCSHFYDTNDPSITMITAPVYEQVKDLAFKELRAIRPSSAGFLPKATRLESSLSHYVNGLTANKPDSFQGRHGEAIGLWFDEATGIERDFWLRAETMFHGADAGAWWLATYNPNDASSYAYAAEESGLWHVVVLNALEHPNIIAELNGRAPPIPAAIRLATIVRRIAAECDHIHPSQADPTIDFEFPLETNVWWHPRTPEFEAQVLGRWPVAPSAALWSPALYEQCCVPMDVDPKWNLAVGCDVARFGDDKTVIVARIGPVAILCESYSGMVTGSIAQRMREVCTILASAVTNDPEERGKLARRIPCYIDGSGGYGAGVYDQNHGFAFIEVNMSSAASDIRFPNLRSQLWCQFADAAISGRGHGVNFSRLSNECHSILRTDLTSARYSLNSKGQRVVEPKVQIKERLGRSPDRADAMILCYSLIGEG